VRQSRIRKGFGWPLQTYAERHNEDTYTYTGPDVDRPGLHAFRSDTCAVHRSTLNCTLNTYGTTVPLLEVYPLLLQVSLASSLAMERR